MALIADDEDAGGGFDDVDGDDLELVELEHTSDLREEVSEAFPVAVEDEEELLAAKFRL